MVSASPNKRLRALSALAGAFFLLASSTFLMRQVHRTTTIVFGNDEAWRPTDAAAVSMPSSQNTTRPTTTAATNSSSTQQDGEVNIVVSGQQQEQDVQVASVDRTEQVVSSPLNSASPTATAPNLVDDSTPEATTTTTNPLDRIKTPFPIFVASLPKSGTTSTARYFHCGDIWTAHTFVNTNGTTHAPRKQMRLGHCMLENIQKGNPPLQDCGYYKVWSDAGHPRGTPCFYPSVHGLQEFYDAYPVATVLLVTRNSTAWSQSMLRWKHGELVRKWRRCQHFPGGKQVTEQDLTTFYEWHQKRLRNFTKHHPSLTYIEVSLEDETIGEQLEDKIGIPAECFGHHNSHEKRMRLNPKFRRQYSAQQQKQEEAIKT